MGGATEGDAKDTTRLCECGHVNQWKSAESLHQTCSECGRVFDQDRNAARNLLASADVVHGGLGTLADIAPAKVTTRITASEWRKRVRENRIARKAVANVSVGKGV